MDDTLLFIPPCCVDRKLPQAINQAPQRMLSFYTHGDVTMEKFYRAISYLLIDEMVMVLSIPISQREMTVINGMGVFLQQCFERKWISHLVLSTRKDCSKIIDVYLGEYRDKILYTTSKDVSDATSHMVLYNKDRALTLSGPMYNLPDMQLSPYSLMFYPNYGLFDKVNDWGNPLRNILMPDVMRHRQQVNKEKREVESGALKLFLSANFPPYKQEEVSAYHGDYHNFSNV